MLSTPLGQHILDYDPPRGFSIPPFAMYDGSSDLYDDMLHFNQAMILNARDVQLLCKVFPTNLKGPALAWSCFNCGPRSSLSTCALLDKKGTSASDKRSSRLMSTVWMRSCKTSK